MTWPLIWSGMRVATFYYETSHLPHNYWILQGKRLQVINGQSVMVVQ